MWQLSEDEKGEESNQEPDEDGALSGVVEEVGEKAEVDAEEEGGEEIKCEINEEEPGDEGFGALPKGEVGTWGWSGGWGLESGFWLGRNWVNWMDGSFRFGGWLVEFFDKSGIWRGSEIGAFVDLDFGLDVDVVEVEFVLESDFGSLFI